MATLAAGCAWAMAYGVLRLLRGDGDGKAVLGIVILAALGALFTAATVGAHRLRQGPARELTVTAEGITTPTGGYAWDDIVAIRASSYLPQGGPAQAKPDRRRAAWDDIVAIRASSYLPQGGLPSAT